MHYLVFAFILLSQGLFAATPHAGIFSTVRGGVFIQRSGNKIFAKLGDKVFEGDTILTEEDSIAKVLYRNNSMIELKDSGNFLVAKVAHEEAKKSMFSLIFGKLRAVVGSRAEDETFEIKAGGTVLGIRGTELQVHILKPTVSDAEETGTIVSDARETGRVIVYSGKVQIEKNDGAATLVEAGDIAKLNCSGDTCLSEISTSAAAFKLAQENLEKEQNADKVYNAQDPDTWVVHTTYTTPEQAAENSKIMANALFSTMDWEDNDNIDHNVKDTTTAQTIEYAVIEGIEYVTEWTIVCDEM